MNWIRFNEDEERLIVMVKTFRGKIENIILIPNKDINTVAISTRKFGFFNPDFKEIALKNNIWDAIILHESMHCFPEFISPWYAPIEILPEKLEKYKMRIIPNSIEDIVINHTLWLWEESPIRSGGYNVPNITKKLIRYFNEFPFPYSLPASIKAIAEYMGKLHFSVLQCVMQQKEGKNCTPHIYLKNKIYGGITKSLARYINELCNSRAVTLSEGGITLQVKINISKNILYETRYRGRSIPQYVPVRTDIISQIYDLLDLHFAEAYDIKVEKLREKAFEHYKKIISAYRSKKRFRKGCEKEVILYPSVYGENKHLVFDFLLKISDKQLPSSTSFIRKSIDFGYGKMTLTKGEIVEPWEKKERIRKIELQRLKKWIK